MTTRRHPAPFSPEVLAAIAGIVAEEHVLSGRRRTRVLDPFAGIGRIHDLSDDNARGTKIVTTGVELEPEWATQRKDTYVGDATQLTELFTRRRFDVIATSPCFGNRMADSHDAKDQCKKCHGRGWHAGPGGITTCPVCKGAGLSRRNTYKAALGRDPSKHSAAVMQWGTEYRLFHHTFIAQALAVLVPRGLMIVNIKNHIRDKTEEPVTEWWLTAMLSAGLMFDRAVRVPSKGQRQGQNHKARLDYEHVLVGRKP